MINYYSYLLVLLLLSGIGMYAVLINEDMDNEIDNLLADNDRMALPYRRFPETVALLDNEICKVYYQKELRIADYLSHKYHNNRHLRVLAANMSLTRMRVWDKLCKGENDYIVGLFRMANRNLAETKQYATYAFHAIQAAGRPNSGFTVPHLMCIADTYYKKFSNSFNNSDYRQTAINNLRTLSDSWMPYLRIVMNLRSSDRITDCNAMNVTIDPLYGRRLSKQMALFDAFHALVKA
ncbi:uncharacterized protein LOC128954547 [Oppia nitens]|uniref:uncharacterized protein LOC128954547 n=1 Tax=Oppia nitens TaxID=1686743 RepID=UPI0023DA5BBD|nr:uncharacterized protein LOC128954547 [Oppia nitens]